MHVMTISSLLISVSYYEKKNNKDKKKKQNKAKKIIKTMLLALIIYLLSVFHWLRRLWPALTAECSSS